MNVKYYNRIAYEEIGEENSKIILFLHSKIVSKWIWIKQKENYDKYFNNYNCIFIDLPHHGKSRFNGEFSINESSEAIIDFIEFLLENKNRDIEKKMAADKKEKSRGDEFSEEKKEKNLVNSINIVALGLGGSIALQILNKKPDLINKLILSGVEIAHKKEKIEKSPISRLAKTKAEFLNLKPDTFIVKAYLRYYGIKKEYYDYLDKDLDLSIKKEKEIAFESYNFTFRDVFKEDEYVPVKNRNHYKNKFLKKEYNSIIDKENILIIYGNKEDITCTQSAIELKNRLINARLIEIDKGNHLWNIIDDELFNNTVKCFLNENKIYKDHKIRIRDQVFK